MLTIMQKKKKKHTILYEKEEYFRYQMYEHHEKEAPAPPYLRVQFNTLLKINVTTHQTSQFRNNTSSLDIKKQTNSTYSVVKKTLYTYLVPFSIIFISNSCHAVLYVELALGISSQLI